MIQTLGFTEIVINQRKIQTQFYFVEKLKISVKKLNHLIIFANLKHLFSDYNGTLILMRSCGFEDKNADPNSCSHQNPPVNRTKPFSCQKCYTDGCNE